ncbi:MAG: serine/threonine-protein kinase [Terracidiphilus sp.]
MNPQAGPEAAREPETVPAPETAPRAAAGPETVRWQRLEVLFHQALEVDADSRAAWIQRACGDDHELHTELESLLAPAEMTLGTVKGAVAEAAEAMLEAEAGEHERFGAYRIVRTLGQGGMGTVYLAERDDDQYRRLVAIKVLRSALSRSPAFQVLFRSERQILADLDHPNIARMLDGGITDQGAPYLVMEYIDGVALDEYCRQHKLGLAARLALFKSLCSAVAYAQSHMVIHRDLKPMNVLVGADGAPKLLDFGIARLMNPYDAHPPGEPSAGPDTERMLTPDYASPEQLLGQPISTATDVYALGVLLYELLTGELPFGGTRSGMSPRESEQSRRDQARAICEQPPQRPSEVCLRIATLPKAEARKLRGDLDSLVLKALRKLPSERYPGAAQMLNDLDRHAKNLPLEAVEPSLAYNLGKFVDRHRVGVSLAGLVVLLVVVFALGMGLLARRAIRGEARARREETFLASIFQTATPEGAKGDKLTTRQLLDQAVGRLDTELADDPQLQGSIAENIAQAYIAQGLYDQAEPLLQRALKLAETYEGKRSKTYGDDLANLANEYRLKGQYERAEPLLREALALAQSNYKARSLQVAHAQSMLGECLYLEDRNTDSETLLRQALETERSIDADAQDGTRNYLALVLERRGGFVEAAQLLREATEMSAKQEGRESSDYLIALHNLAGAEIDAGDLDGAARSEREVLTTRRKIWGHDHPDTAYSLNNLGFIYLEQGRWQQAEPLLLEDIAVTSKLADGINPRYAVGLANVGRVEEQKGDFASAASYYDKGLQVLAAGGRSNSLIDAKIEIYQAQLANDRGDPASGQRIAEHALQLERKLGGETSPMVASGLLTLGESKLLSGNAAGAEAAFRQAMQMRQGIYAPTHPEFLLAQTRVSESLLAQGRNQEALQIAATALSSAQSAPFALPTWRLAEIKVVKSLALAAVGRDSESTPLLVGTATELASYNQPAIRQYLLALLQGSAQKHT